MAEETAILQVYVTSHILADGVIEAVWAEVTGACCRISEVGEYRYLAGEGANWHRTRWAAENYARQRQAEYLRQLRSEIERIEGYRFGRPGR
ncbi:hypothetical protein [Methylobacterium sp. E-066]|uniref:hypothetical protein n=1 Tax=Methylobacterium sp. E-066 TaxID=2836584 RepID=UPI001FB86CD8|nr:hypothetical protein [Methylobacterium sp. E-066]MCJ2143659.1 hypothetical protein [Methylobacterium sp. E-066]